MQESVRHGFFLLLVAIVTLAFGLLVRDLLLSCFWAVVLAVLFQPMHQAIRAWFRGRDDLAALASTTLVVLLVLIPVAIATQRLAAEAWQLSTQIADGTLDPSRALDLLESRFPGIQDLAADWNIPQDEIRKRLREGALVAAQVTAAKGLGFAQDFLALFVSAALSIYLLFFFLRDGDQLVRGIGEALPLRERDQVFLFGRFVRAARATVKGIAIVAVVQGLMGGLLFWALGLPAPVLWGTVMGLLSVVPFGGSGFVWLPAALLLLLGGEVVRPSVLIGVGFFIIMSVDNLLRPRLVGNDLHIPDFLVLLSTFGGLAWFGLTGFLLGPVLAALFLAFWRMVGRRYGRGVRDGNAAVPLSPDEPCEGPAP